jgi:MFS family permease
LRKHARQVLLGAGGRAAEAGFVSIFSIFILGYAVQSGVPRPVMLSALSIATLGIILIVPLAAALSDRLGRRVVYLAGAAFATLIALPVCLLIDTRQPGLITLGLVLGMLGPAVMFGPQASFIAELFPTRVRSSGSSLTFQLGGVLFGGITPVVAAALVPVTGSLVAVAAFMLALGVVSIASVAMAQVPAKRETTGAMSLSAALGITA